MEEGEGSTSSGPRRQKPQTKTSEEITYEESVMNLSLEGRRTHLTVSQNRKRSLNSILGSSCTIFDNTFTPYNWLRTGWLVEERRMLWTNRIYRYYYDPMGQMYNTRQEVELIYEDIEKYLDKKNSVIIVLDN